MGCFDTIYYKCAECGEETSSQTKLGEGLLEVWEVGETTTLPDGIFVLKDSCTNCGATNAIEVREGVFVRVASKEEAHGVEGRWGNFGRYKGDII